MNRKRRMYFFFTLLSILALFSTLLAAVPQRRAHAQDCMECIDGGEPTTPGPDPTEDPDDPDDPGPDPTDDPDDDDDPPATPEPPCTPNFEPPYIGSDPTSDPPYPITIGQDPDDRGVDVRGITANGGRHHCPEGGPARIVSFTVTRVQLAQSSIAWITGELARKYPGAQVKGSYPFTPAFNVTGLGTGQARLSFHLAPLDPGYYDVTVQAMQEDGQTATATARVAVYLMESTIIQ